MEETITITRQILLLTFLISFLIGMSLGILITSCLWLGSSLNRFKASAK